MTTIAEPAAIALLPVSVAAPLRAMHRETLLRAIRAGKVRSYPTPGGHHRVRLTDIDAAFTAA